MGTNTLSARGFFALSVAIGCGSGSAATDAGVNAGAEAGADAGPAVLATWSSSTPMPASLAIAYTRTVAVANRLFVLGGRTLNTEAGAGQPALGVYAFDPIANQWEEHESLPQRIEQPNVAAVGSNIYVLGGAGVTQVYVYDPTARTWTSKGMRPVPLGIGASAVAVLGTKIYLAGGVVPSDTNPRGARIPDFAAYDTAADTWEALPPMVEESGYFGAAIIGGFLFTIGGSTEKREIARPGKTFAYDFAAATWTEKALAPSAVSSFASATWNDRIYLMGGIVGATGRIDSETQVYDPKTDVWTFTTPMMTGRFAMGAATLGDKIYVPGGVQQVSDVDFVAVPNVDVLGP